MRDEGCWVWLPRAEYPNESVGCETNPLFLTKIVKYDTFLASEFKTRLEECMKTAPKSSFLLLALGLSLIVTGCSTEKLSRRGQDVEAVYHLDHKGCANLGPVTGKGGGALGGGLMSEEKLIHYAINDLRNKASQKNATHVVMSSPNLSKSTFRYGGGSAVTGIAYRCPESW